MRIEKFNKSDMKKMSDLELHEQREQFVQVHEAFWKHDCWPAISKPLFVKKYDMLCREMDRRKIVLKPRDVDVTLIRKSLARIGRGEPEPEDPPTPIKHSIRLIKADIPERIVFGIVAEPDTEDSQGDQQTAEEIEKASIWFMETAQNIKVTTDEDHDDDDFKASLLENYVTRSDMSIEGEVIKKGTWLQMLRLDEDTWDKVESGELTGFSMAGTAIREQE